MAKLINILGKTFGKWTVISKSEIKRSWLCRCICGNERIIIGISLRNGHSKSCGCEKALNLIGQKFGDLFVISRVENNKNGGSQWLCKCVCGKEKIINGNGIYSGRIKSCGCLRTNFLENQVFGRLTAICRIKEKYRTFWLCNCTCGNETIVNESNLLNGTTKSCGCLLKETASKRFIDYNREKEVLPDGIAARNIIISGYKTDAKRRNLCFELSIERTVELFLGSCYYCGVLPYNECSVSYANGSFTYNGIDRVDNDLGYIDSNVVSCCFICNQSKMARKVDEFISWIHKASEYLKSK